MSINKKIVIGIVASGIIVISSIVGISIYQNKNMEGIVNGENNTNSMQENTITNTNEVINTEIENIIQESEIEDEENIMNNETEQKNEESSTNNDTEPKKQESTTQSSAKKEESQNNKQNEQITQNKPTTQSQDNKQNQQTSQVKPQQEQQTTQSSTSQQQTSQEETKKEEITTKPVVERCSTNNNHGMSVGNSGKWFKTQADAVSTYNQKLTEYDADVKSGKISYEEYLKKCPYGYEVWTCPYCNLWTINYYYE